MGLKGENQAVLPKNPNSITAAVLSSASDTQLLLYLRKKKTVLCMVWIELQIEYDGGQQT